MTRRFCAVGLALLALVTALPVSDAGMELRERSYALSSLQRGTIWINTTASPPDSQSIRVDADDNGDGVVTVAERVAYETRVRTQLQDQLRDHPPFTLDDRAPDRTDATRVDTRNLEGPVSSEEDLDVDTELRVEFNASSAAAEHAFARSVGSEDKGPLSIQVPADFLLIRGKGVLDYRVSADGRALTGRSDGQSPLEVRFANRALAGQHTPGDFNEKDGAGGYESPAPGFAFALACLGAAGLAWKRNRPT